MMRKITTLLIVVFGIILPHLQAELTLVWLPPESGPEVAGYYIYQKEIETGRQQRFDAGNNLTILITNLTIGHKYVFFATAFNHHGLESVPSNTFEWISKGRSPEAPYLLRITNKQ